MEIGRGKKRCRQAFAARTSPSLGVLFWPAFDNASVKIDVIVCNYCVFVFLPLSLLRSDCYGFTIPSMWVCVSVFSASCCRLTVMELRGLFIALSAEAVEIQWEQESGRVCSLLKFHFVSQNQHSWFVVVWPCISERVCGARGQFQLGLKGLFFWQTGHACNGCRSNGKPVEN